MGVPPYFCLTMSSGAVAASPSVVFKRATIRETVVLLAVAWLVPFLVHLVPWTGARPLGAHLLPMFWTALAAVHLFGLRTGLLVGLFAPALNLALTGLPAWSRLAMLGFEITVFVALVWWLTCRGRTAWYWAPLAYVVAKLASALLLLLGAGKSVALLPGSLLAALPGLAVLAGVNLVLTRMYPRGVGPRADDAAGV